MKLTSFFLVFQRRCLARTIKLQICFWHYWLQTMSLYFFCRQGSVKVGFRVIIVIVATDPKNATTISDRMAETAHRLLVEAKDGFVKQLQVDPNVVVKSKALPFSSLLGQRKCKDKNPNVLIVNFNNLNDHITLSFTNPNVRRYLNIWKN